MIILLILHKKEKNQKINTLVSLNIPKKASKMGTSDEKKNQRVKIKRIWLTEGKTTRRRKMQFQD